MHVNIEIMDHISLFIGSISLYCKPLWGLENSKLMLNPWFTFCQTMVCLLQTVHLLLITVGTFWIGYTYGKSNTIIGRWMPMLTSCIPLTGFLYGKLLCHIKWHKKNHNSPMWWVVVGGGVAHRHPTTNHNSSHRRVVAFSVPLYVALKELFLYLKLSPCGVVLSF